MSLTYSTNKLATAWGEDDRGGLRSEHELDEWIHAMPAQKRGGACKFEIYLALLSGKRL